MYLAYIDLCTMPLYTYPKYHNTACNREGLVFIWIDIQSSSSSSAASTVGVVPPVIPNTVKGADAFLQVCATWAAAIATATANDAAVINSAQNIIIKKHHTMFLQRAFGINPNSMAVDQALLPLSC
jgi:hypothetical protein